MDAVSCGCGTDPCRSSLRGTCCSKFGPPQVPQSWVAHTRRTPSARIVGSRPLQPFSYPSRIYGSWRREHHDRTVTLGTVCFYNTDNWNTNWTHCSHWNTLISPNMSKKVGTFLFTISLAGAPLWSEIYQNFNLDYVTEEFHLLTQRLLIHFRGFKQILLKCNYFRTFTKRPRCSKEIKSQFAWQLQWTWQ